MPQSTCATLWRATVLAFLFTTIVSRSQSLLQVRPHHTSRSTVTSVLPRVSYGETLLFSGYDSNKSSSRIEGPPHVETILFVECGFGNDSHGEYQ